MSVKSSRVVEQRMKQIVTCGSRASVRSFRFRWSMKSASVADFMSVMMHDRALVCVLCHFVHRFVHRRLSRTTIFFLRNIHHLLVLASSPTFNCVKGYGPCPLQLINILKITCRRNCYNSLHSLFHYATRLYWHLFLSHLPLLFTHTCLL